MDGPEDGLDPGGGAHCKRGVLDSVGCASVLVYMRLKSSVVAVKTVTQMEMRNGPRPSRTLDSCLIIGRQGQSLVHFP